MLIPSRIDLINQHLSCLRTPSSCFQKQWASRMTRVSSKYWKQIWNDSLTSELQLLPTVFECEPINLEEEFNVLQSLSREKRMLVRNFVAVIRIILNAVATSATLEWSFLMLRRIKTWLQSRMTQKRLNFLSILSKNKSILDDISLLHVVKKFVEHHTDRKTLLVVLWRKIFRSLHIFSF